MLEMKLVIIVAILAILISGIGTAMTESFLRYEQRLAQESFDQAITQARETTLQVQHAGIAQK
jgi:hypothetical protein